MLYIFHGFVHVSLVAFNHTIYVPARHQTRHLLELLPSGSYVIWSDSVGVRVQS